MSITIEECTRRLQLPTLFSYAFRPLFLAAGSWAIVGIAVKHHFKGNRLSRAMRAQPWRFSPSSTPSARKPWGLYVR